MICFRGFKAWINGITFNKRKENINEDKIHLEINKIILVYCNIVNNDYQRDSRLLYTFISNKSFRQLLEISTTNLICLKTFNSELLHVEV